jgi:hypothetical protein
VCLLDIIIDNRIKFVLRCSVSASEYPELRSRTLSLSSPQAVLRQHQENHSDIPIVLTGDFNIDVQGNQSLLDFMKREFRL